MEVETTIPENITVQLRLLKYSFETEVVSALLCRRSSAR
jgi:hypothetical protein